MKREEEATAGGADTVKEWMEAHPGGYARFAARIKTEGIRGILKLGEGCFPAVSGFPAGGGTDTYHQAV